MLLMTNCRHPDESDDAIAQEAIPVGRGHQNSREPMPSTRTRFLEYDKTGQLRAQYHPDAFKERLEDSPESQLLLYLYGIKDPKRVDAEVQELVGITAELQEQCENNAPGLVLVVPVVWTGADHRPEGRADVSQDEMSSDIRN